MIDLENYIMKNFGIDKNVINFCSNIEKKISSEFNNIDKTGEFNQYKVLKAMQKNKLSDIHFAATTGYGYNDIGRDTLENIYSDVFNTECSIVRPQIISGTHALTVALFGNLKYGDELLSPVGKPYDTLESVIGSTRKIKGSLTEYGIIYKQVDLLQDGNIDYEKIPLMINQKTKLVTIQRSKGYCFRPSLTIDEIKKLIKFIKDIRSDIICMVDNCYGEFVDILEPSDVGADLVVGSLIKNPGGGLAPVGGYITGKEEYVENAAYRLTSPGLGREVGPSLGIIPSLIQGLFLSPQVVCGSLKGAVFASAIFKQLGFNVMPEPFEKRTDIVQAIKMNCQENIITFCQGIQKGAAVDSYVIPEPWDMPGYDCKVIMAAGAFVQGSSIELSADAPIREPYIVYLQGGLTWFHAKIGIIIAVNEMVKNNQIKL